MSKKYILEIYEPNSTDEVVKVFESDSLFLNISKNDIINPAFFGNQPADIIFRVKNIEHIIWESDKEIKHKICIFVQQKEDTKEERLN